MSKSKSKSSNRVPTIASKPPVKGKADKSKPPVSPAAAPVETQPAAPAKTEAPASKPAPVAKDYLGYRVTSSASRINMGLSGEWQSVKAVVALQGPRPGVHSHFNSLYQAGLIERGDSTNGGPAHTYRLTAASLKAKLAHAQLASAK